MKLSKIIVGGLGALTILECTYAYPGMEATVREIEQSIQESQQGSDLGRLTSNARHQTTEVYDSNEVGDSDQVENANEVHDPGNEAEDVLILIGDSKDDGTTPVGKTIARRITEQETDQSSAGDY